MSDSELLAQLQRGCLASQIASFKARYQQCGVFGSVVAAHEGSPLLSLLRDRPVGGCKGRGLGLGVSPPGTVSVLPQAVLP